MATTMAKVDLHSAMLVRHATANVAQAAVTWRLATVRTRLRSTPGRQQAVATVVTTTNATVVRQTPVDVRVTISKRVKCRAERING